jgi:hypothetical protein
MKPFGFGQILWHDLCDENGPQKCRQLCNEMLHDWYPSLNVGCRGNKKYKLNFGGKPHADKSLRKSRYDIKVTYFRRTSYWNVSCPRTSRHRLLVGSCGDGYYFLKTE